MFYQPGDHYLPERNSSIILGTTRDINLTVLSSFSLSYDGKPSQIQNDGAAVL